MTDYTRSWIEDDFRFDRTDYHVNDGWIICSSKRIAAGVAKTNRNNSDTMQTMEFSFSMTSFTAFTFSRTHGFEFTVGVEATVKKPLVLDSSITVEISTAHDWPLGCEITEERTIEIRIISNAPPRSHVREPSSIILILMFHSLSWRDLLLPGLSSTPMVS